MDGTGAISFESAEEHSKKLKPEAKKMNIKIIEPQPFIDVRSTLFNGGNLTINEGAIDKATIELINNSAIPIDFITLEVEERLSVPVGIYDTRRVVFTWEKEEETRQIIKQPLLPGKKIFIRIDLFGLRG